MQSRLKHESDRKAQIAAVPLEGLGNTDAMPDAAAPAGPEPTVNEISSEKALSLPDSSTAVTAQ